MLGAYSKHSSIVAQKVRLTLSILFDLHMYVPAAIPVYSRRLLLRNVRFLILVCFLDRRYSSDTI